MYIFDEFFRFSFLYYKQRNKSKLNRSVNFNKMFQFYYTIKKAQYTLC